MKNLSVALATYNEQDMIKSCLDSVSELSDEIIIVDGSSTDKTREIARGLGAKVYKVTNKKNFHINKQIAIDKCKNEWILQLDADERLTEDLREEISKILKKDYTKMPSAFYIKRRNYFLGRWMKKGGMYPDPVIRLIKKGRARLPQKNVHELMEVDGEVGWLENDLLHYADPSFERYLIRSDRYTSLDANNYKKNNLKTDVLTKIKYLYALPLIRFISIYVRHKGFLDGKQGFIFAYYSALHIRTSYKKYLNLSKYEN